MTKYSSMRALTAQTAVATLDLLQFEQYINK